MFGPAFNVEVEVSFFQSFFNGLHEIIDQPFSGSLAGVQPGGDVFKLFGMGVFQVEIFQFRLDLVQSETVGQRRINIDGLVRDLKLGIFGHAVERTHIMQAVSQLDQDHAYVL
ncbi:hypothetical protein D9M69_594380 [compost metagenome]